MDNENAKKENELADKLIDTIVCFSEQNVEFTLIQCLGCLDMVKAHVMDATNKESE